MKHFKGLSGVFLSILLLSQVAFFVTPLVAMSQGLVPCGTLSAGDGTVSNPCEWKHLIELVVNITNFLVIIGAAFSAVAFGYAGFLMMTASGEMGKIEEAKAIFSKVLVGFLFMLSAWLIVHAIESAFLDSTKFTSLLR